MSRLFAKAAQCLLPPRPDIAIDARTTASPSSTVAPRAALSPTIAASGDEAHAFAVALQPQPGLLAAVLVFAGVGASHAEVRIADDRGGIIGTYVDKYQDLRASGETVVIDGLCASACTVVLAAVPA